MIWIPALAGANNSHESQILVESDCDRGAKNAVKTIVVLNRHGQYLTSTRICVNYPSRRLDLVLCALFLDAVSL